MKTGSVSLELSPAIMNTFTDDSLYAFF